MYYVTLQGIDSVTERIVWGERGAHWTQWQARAGRGLFSALATPRPARAAVSLTRIPSARGRLIRRLGTVDAVHVDGGRIRVAQQALEVALKYLFPHRHLLLSVPG